MSQPRVQNFSPGMWPDSSSTAKANSATSSEATPKVNPPPDPGHVLPDLGNWSFTSAYTTFIVVWKFLVQLFANIPVMGSFLEKTPEVLEKLTVVTEKLDILLGRNETLLGGSERIYNFAIQPVETSSSIFPANDSEEITISKPVMDVIDVFFAVVSNGEGNTFELLRNIMVFSMEPSDTNMQSAMATFEPHLKRDRVEKSTMSLLALFVSLSMKVCQDQEHLLLTLRQWIEQYEDYVPHELYIPMHIGDDSDSELDVTETN